MPLSARPVWVFPILIALLLSGCPPEDPALPPTLPSLEPGKAPLPGPGEPQLGPDGHPKQVVRVCVMLPASGPSKDLGAEMRRGVGIAQKELMANRDLARVFEWTEKDTKSTEPGAISAFTECFGEGHHVIVGPVHPAGTTALIPVAASHDVILMIPEVGAAVPSVWSDNLFAIAPPATEMGRLAGENARRERALTKAAVLHVPGVFGENLRDAFITAFTATPGAEVVAKTELPPDKPEEWAKAAEDAKAAGADALFIIGPPEPSKAVAATYGKDTGGSHAWFVDWSMHPPVLDAAGVAGKSRVHWVNRALPAGAFEEEYLERYQARPEYSAGAAYDAVKLAGLAAATAETTWHEDVSKTLKAMKDTPGAFGDGNFVMTDGVSYQDVAGYRIIEPVKLPDSDVWVFGGFR